MIKGSSFWKQARQQHLKMLDAAIFLGLAGLVLYTVSNHEPWADEADTWLEVRDLSWARLLFSELRYDGHLPLWHAVVWVPQHLFHMPYDYFVFIGGTCAVAGLCVLIFLAPFPRPLRYLIGGSFFFAYQYAVVARPYVLMPLLGFLAAHFYRQGLRRVQAFGIAIALLIQDSSYAAVIGIGLSAFYALQLAPRWKEISTDERSRVSRAAVLIAASVVFAVLVLFPKADSSLLAASVHNSLWNRVQKVPEGATGGFAETMPAALALLILACLWSHVRRGWLLFLLAVGGTSLEYGFLWGYGHHQGLITIAFVVFLWAVWPGAEERARMEHFSKWVHQAFLVALLVTFGWQCAWSYKAMRGDWAGPYSGAQDAARYLKSVHAENLGVSGYTFWAVGLQPYFDHNIFLNYGGPNSPANYHFSKGFDTRANSLMESQLESGPPFIVFAQEMDPQDAAPIVQQFRAANYVLVHLSDGRRFFKGQPGPHAPYFIFEKVDFALAARKP
jgi:hypothetical protein